MGWFKRFLGIGNHPQEDEVLSSSSSSMGYDETIQYYKETLEQPEVRTQLTFFVMILAMLIGIRLLTTSRVKALSGEHVLNMHHLNDAILVKEGERERENRVNMRPHQMMISLDGTLVVYILRML